MERIRHSALAVLASVLIGLVIVLVAMIVNAEAASVTLAWTDNSTNEAVFNIERKGEACAASGLPFGEIATVTANVITYKDVGLPEGSVWCYRVAASNTAGKSGYTNTAGLSVPFTVPGDPSGLTVTVGP